MKPHALNDKIQERALGSTVLDVTLLISERPVMEKIYLPYIVLVACLSGCSVSDTVNSDSNNMLGSDTDVHGCIGSAGYLWCDRSRKCERPWELAESEGFDNNAEQFDEYCKG